MELTKQTRKLYSHFNTIFFRPKYRRPFFVLALVLIVFLLPLAQHALAVPTAAPSAGGAASTVGSWILGGASALVTPVLQLIEFFCGMLVSIAANFLSFMLKPDLYNFTTEPIIVQGWTMVRDVCNLFFLLILLFIAFCTILQIEKYHLKKTLLTLVIMALLINFSKPIAIFIFDGAQLLMNYFLGAIGDYGTTATNLSQISSIIGKDLPNFSNTFISAASGGSGFTGAAMQYLFAIIFLFMYATALFVIGIYLLIRIVALWLLVIISPLAFLAMAVPDFKKMSNEWWDALFKYSYVGPAMAFFLWLSTKLATSFFVTTAKKFGNKVDIISMANLISFMTIIVFLYASIIMAQKFGIQFASAITKGANNFMKWVPGWADRRFLQKTWKIPGTGVGINTSWISPGAWKAGWKTHWDEVNRKKLEQASAAPRDLLSRVFQRGEKHKTYYRDLAFAKLEGEKMKELQSISVESSFLLDQIDRAKKRGGIEGQATASAAMKLIAQQNDEDDYSIDGKNEEHDPLKTKRHILDDLKATGMSEDRAAKIMFQMGHIALPAGNMGYWKMAEFNKKTQNYEVTKDEDQLAGIRAKSQTFETQGLAKILHRDAFMVENAERGVDTEGKPTYKRIFTKVHDVGIEEADLIGGNAAALRQFVQRAKVDTLHAVGGQTGEYDSMKLWTAASERAANKFENAAEKMRQAGRTVEVDANLKRAEEIKHNILRFGEAVVHAYAGRSAREEGATSPESAVNVNKEMLEVMKGIKSELGNLRNR